MSATTLSRLYGGSRNLVSDLDPLFGLDRAAQFAHARNVARDLDLDLDGILAAVRDLALDLDLDLAEPAASPSPRTR